MGGGDLNMKKSWHPLLQVNQERVWKREQEATEERKKLEELRREREQEREMQELQRLQEEAGGKKRIDKVDWMYATPAAQSGPSSSEMEDYLLGKKRVDKLLKADDAHIEPRSDQTGFISLQNANNSRDLAAKVREDPMLAIKQQEQAAYEALLRDPTRLRQMKRKAGIETESVDETREERRRRKEEKRLRHYHKDEKERHRRSRAIADAGRMPKDDRHSSTERSPIRPNERSQGSQSYRNSSIEPRHRSRRERTDPSDSRRREEEQSSLHSAYRRFRGSVEGPQNSDVSKEDRSARRDYGPKAGSKRQTATREERNCETRNFAPTADDEQRRKADREAKLLEMTKNAVAMQEQRKSYVSHVNSEEAEQDRREAELRQKLIDSRQKGHSDGKGAFILGQQRSAFADDLELADRIKRGRGYQTFES